MVAQVFPLTTDWQRYHLTFEAPGDTYFQIGPDLRNAVPPLQKGGPGGVERATVWLDAVQLEAGEEPSDYQPKRTVEMGLETAAAGNVWEWGKPAEAILRLVNHAAEPQVVEAQVTATDFFDQETRLATVQRELPPGATVAEAVRLPERKGFFRVRADATLDGRAVHADLRAAIIQPYDLTANNGDSRFGLNHAFSWDGQNRLCLKMGVTWARDWSIQWRLVEPEPGRFDFTIPDVQIDRVRQLGMNVLGLLPFPSSLWSTTAPEDQRHLTGYPGLRRPIAFAPQNPEDFGNVTVQVG
jgi:hypothetical protein